jgi:hypothetical protein
MDLTMRNFFDYVGNKGRKLDDWNPICDTSKTINKRLRIHKRIETYYE